MKVRFGADDVGGVGDFVTALGHLAVVKYRPGDSGAVFARPH